LKRTIEELQDKVILLERSATGTVDYVDERPQEVRKRRCVHKDIEESIGARGEVFLGHDQIFERHYTPIILVENSWRRIWNSTITIFIDYEGIRLARCLRVDIKSLAGGYDGRFK
jgi:hypothetical protein